jgi:hypothetical protein
MATTTQERANTRFNTATAFLASSHTLLSNNMIYASAQADAISAIKSILQGYLYTKIAGHPDAPGAPSWQEAADGNSIPAQLTASKAAGLVIPEELERRIRHWNHLRNRREHDDPNSRVNHHAAQDALRAAEEMQQLVRIALGMAPAPVVPIPARAPATQPRPVPVPAPPFPASAAGPTPIPAPTATAGSSRQRGKAQPASSRRASGWRRVVRVLGRIAAVLLLLLVGLAAGVGIMIPVASGNAPSWLSFAMRLLPTPSAAPTQTPVPTATVASGPIILGEVTVSAPACGVGGASFQLHNTGTEPVRWAVGSPGGSTAMFALAAGETPQVTLFGTLASASEVTIYASGARPVVLTTDGGAVQLTLPAC